VFSCVAEIANSRKRVPATVKDVLTELENGGLVKSVAALRLPPS
jgi:DNA-binding IscR family transcriptional regulator